MPFNRTYPDIIYLNNMFRSVSLNMVLNDGVAGIYRNDSSDNFKASRVNWFQDSAGRNDIYAIWHQTATMIEHSPSFQRLLNKPEWSREDRSQWEAMLAQAVRDQIERHPRFGQYRLDRSKSMSLEITQIGPDTNFHCEPLALLTGLSVQRLENHFLPTRHSDDSNAFKQAGTYYFSGGVIDTPAVLGPAGVDQAVRTSLSGETLHAFTLTPLANIIEATLQRRDPTSGAAHPVYVRNAQQGYNREHFFAGFPLFNGSMKIISSHPIPARQGLHWPIHAWTQLGEAIFCILNSAMATASLSVRWMI